MAGMMGTPVSSVGRIVAREADSRARLVFSRPAGCSGCGAAGSCGSRLLAPSTEPHLMLPIKGGVGQRIRISLSGRSLLLLVCLVYLLIPVGMLIGAALASALAAGSDLAATGGALLGGWVGYALLKLYHSRHAAAGEFPGLIFQSVVGQ